VFAILQFVFTKNLNALTWRRHTHILESSESGNRAYCVTIFILIR